MLWAFMLGAHVIYSGIAVILANKKCCDDGSLI